MTIADLLFVGFVALAAIGVLYHLAADDTIAIEEWFEE